MTVDNRGRGARLTLHVFAQFHVQLLSERIPHAVLLEIAKDVVDGRARGDVWLWVATDADTRLVPSWLVGSRDAECANVFIADIAARLAKRIQLTSDGHGAYLQAVEGAFGADVYYAQLVKLYGEAPDGAKDRYSPAECTGAKKTPITGNPDKKYISTS